MGNTAQIFLKLRYVTLMCNQNWSLFTFPIKINSGNASAESGALELLTC